MRQQQKRKLAEMGGKHFLRPHTQPLADWRKKREGDATRGARFFPAAKVADPRHDVAHLGGGQVKTGGQSPDGLKAGRIPSFGALDGAFTQPADRSELFL